MDAANKEIKNELESQKDQWVIKTPSRMRAEKRSEDFSFFGKKPFSPESLEKFESGSGTYVRELGSHILGGVGDIENFARGLFNLPGENLFPTSENVKTGFIDKLSPILKEIGERGPQNKTEEFLGKMGQISGSLLGLGGIGNQTRSMLTLPFLGAGTERAIKELGGDEKDAAIGSAITMGIAGLRGTGGARTIMREVYQDAERALPQGALYRSPRLNRELAAMRTQLSRGIQGAGSPVGQRQVQTLLDSLDNLMTGTGNILVQDLWAVKRQLGEIIRELPRELQGARRYINGIQRSVNGALENYGRTQNPAFLRSLRRGDRIYRGIYDSQGILNQLAKKSGATGKTVLGYMGVTHPIAAAGGLIGGWGVNQLTKMFRNPELARVYLQLMGRAARNDLKGATSSFKKLMEFPETQELKPDKKNPWRIIPSQAE